MVTSLVLLLAGLGQAAVGATQVLDIGPARATLHRGAPLRGQGAQPLEVLGPVRAEVVEQLPQGWRLGGLRLLGPVPRAALGGGGGAVRVQVAMPATLSPGQNRADVILWRGEAPVGHTAAELTLWPALAARAPAVVGRGQEVVVVVRNGNVTVQTKGVTQQSASLGERIGVLPNGSTHTVQGYVRDAKTVEVPL